VAFWVGSELFAAGGPHVAITMVPGQGGVFKVTLNGEVAFDKMQIDRYPTLNDVKDLKAKVINMIDLSS
tara:strand:+ start:3993 stop:4199 length:207 start_codon:yes stop_codon:yes gene_type:complete